MDALTRPAQRVIYAADRAEADYGAGPVVVAGRGGLRPSHGSSATWKELLEAVEASDTETASDRALSLMEWLARGGFPPVTGNNLSLTADQHRQIVRDYCRNVLRQSVETSQVAKAP